MGRAAFLADDQRRTLARLSEVSEARELVLVGGTALAFHLQHRRSLDLDLFGDASIDIARIQDALTGAFPEAEVLSSTDAALQLKVADTPIDIVRYKYPLLVPAATGPEGVRVASIRDLAAMKLAAISKRGLRRDFWDLHVITTQHRGLNEIADDYRAKFGKSEADLYHVARALTYFEDAERAERLPAGLTPEKWSEIKTYFRNQAKQLLKPD